MEANREDKMAYSSNIKMFALYIQQNVMCTGDRTRRFYVGSDVEGLKYHVPKIRL